MTPKLDPFAAAPLLMKKWMGMSTDAAASLEASIIELVKIRASQINGCANCINMHTSEARAKARPNSASICSPLGARPYAIPNVSVRHSAGRTH